MKTNRQHNLDRFNNITIECNDGLELSLFNYNEPDCMDIVVRDLNKVDCMGNDTMFYQESIGYDNAVDIRDFMIKAYPLSIKELAKNLLDTLVIKLMNNRK